MGNFLNFSVKTREELKDYIITRLGAPLVTVELSDEQLDVAINQSMEEYTKYISYDLEFLAVDLSKYGRLTDSQGNFLKGDVQTLDANGVPVFTSIASGNEVLTPDTSVTPVVYYYMDTNGVRVDVDPVALMPVFDDAEIDGMQMPDSIMGVSRVDDSGFTTNGMGIDNLFSVPNQMYNNGDLSFGVNGVMGLVNYDLFKRRMKLLKKVFAAGYDFSYNERKKLLKLTPDPRKIGYTGYVVLTTRLMRSDDENYGESWVKQFALEVAKEMLSYVRGKFEGTQLLGGAKIDSNFRDSSVSKQEKLIEELRDMQGPLDFSVG